MPDSRSQLSFASEVNLPPYPTLPRDLVTRCGRNFPNKPAYICGPVSRSWGEVEGRAGRIAAVYQGLGCRVGDAVGFLSPECIEVYEHFFACLKIGAIRVGLNRRLSIRELAHVVRDSGLRSILVHRDCLDLLAALQETGALEGVTLIGFGDGHGLPLDLETLMAAAPAEPDYPALDPSHPAFYSYTSGTTGLPKGVVLTHAAVRATLPHAVAAFGLSSEDIFYMPVGNAWVGFMLGVIGAANGMATLIPEGQFELEKLLPELEKYGATALMLVPTMLQWAADEHRKGKHDLSKLRFIATGSSPVSPKLLRDADEVFGCGLINCYALTETAWGGVSFLMPGEVKRGLKDRPEILFSVGQVSTLFDISIRDDEGKPLATGEVGEVWLRGETCMAGYLNQPEQNAEVIVDGWMRTNDVGKLDEDGYLYLLDRRKFMIISGGVNVYPNVVEAAIAEHPAVAESCVVGVAHPTWGEAVTAVIRLKPGSAPVTQEELRQHCRERLNRIQVPKHFHLTDEPLPRTTTGKMQKAEVRAWFTANPSLAPWN